MINDTKEHKSNADSTPQIFYDDYICLHFENEQETVDDYRFVNDLKHHLNGFQYVILCEHLVGPTATSIDFVVYLPLDHVVERSQTLEIADRLTKKLGLKHCHTMCSSDEENYQEYINGNVTLVESGHGRKVPVHEFLGDYGTATDPVRTVDEYGNIEYKLNGVRHRDDGPALDCNGRFKYWYQHGKLHRDGLPAVEGVPNDDGTMEYTSWFDHGKQHRVGGPAIEHWNAVDACREWWVNGKRHREDGPAIENIGGSSYMMNGEKTHANGPHVWCLDNVEYTFREWIKLTPIPQSEKIWLILKHSK
jgi:hypothetical protein